MLTQIHEVSTRKEAEAICKIGIDHIGVLVGKGEFPREQTLQTAETIAGGVRPPSKLSALFLTADISLIEEWTKKLQPAILHIGAAPELLGPKDAATPKSKLPDVLLRPTWMARIRRISTVCVASTKRLAGRACD